MRSGSETGASRPRPVRRARHEVIGVPQDLGLYLHSPEWQQRMRYAARGYLDTTSFGPDRYKDHRMDPLLEGIRDAADECRHGNLPPTACGCW